MLCFLFTILTVIISLFSGFIVEHDFIMATYLADRVIVFEGTPSINTKACAPQSLLTGMNKFLEQLQITFRRDPSNFRLVSIFYFTYYIPARTLSISELKSRVLNWTFLA